MSLRIKKQVTGRDETHTQIYSQKINVEPVTVAPSRKQILGSRGVRV